LGLKPIRGSNPRASAPHHGSDLVAEDGQVAAGLGDKSVDRRFYAPRMTVPDGYVLALSDPRQSTDAEIEQGWRFSEAYRQEFFPEEPGTELATAITATRNLLARWGLWRVRIYDATGELVAGTTVFKDWQNDSNPDVGGLSGNVHAEHRGCGLGTVLLAWQVAFAQALGQTRILMGTDSRLPRSVDLVKVLGAELKQEEHENRLTLADVDSDLLHRWIADASAGDYELVAIDGRIPDDLAQAYVDLVLVMNTAPRDDLQLNDFTYSVAELREQEERQHAVGGLTWNLIARHRGSGDLVGVHTIAFSPDDKEKCYVGITGVVPEHRGHRLGRWLKAAMTLRLMDECPQIGCVVTGNADSNEAMLAINREMGYRPHASGSTWEVGREHLEKLLEHRGVEIPTDLAAAAVSSQAPA
jgi:mycothiol synthase